MKNTIKKLLLMVFAFVFMYTITSLSVFSATEPLVINSTTIYHYNSDEEVTISDTYDAKLDQLRGMWLATVWNQDIKRTSSVSEFKNQYIKILDMLEQYNFNTVFFQIRPNNDAFYVSELNPWSRWLTGSQGRALTEDSNVFDPLEWIIDVTHERGMQLIGWMNAYRVSYSNLYSDSSNNYSESAVTTKVNQTLNALDPLNFARKYPQYVLLGDEDSKLILNPGERAVQQFITNTVEEIVSKYDIDGVHFDDYFYLDSTNSSAAERVVTSEADYAAADTAFNNYYNDYKTYLNNRLNSSETLADFRRRSVNLMMESISNAIKKVNETQNKTVQFGAKPAAVWASIGRNVDNRPAGANVATYSYSSYHDIFADSLYWAEKGWIDWISPQVYYNFENREVPYADIVKWWSDVMVEVNQNLESEGKKPVKLYIAHGVYRMDASDTSGKQITDSTELKKQLLFNEKFANISGSAFYNYVTFASATKLVVEARDYLSTLWDQKTIVNHTGQSTKVICKSSFANGVISFPKDNFVRNYLIYKANGNNTIQESDLVAILDNSDADADGNINYTVDDANTKYAIVVVDKNFVLSSEYIIAGNDYEHKRLYTNDSLILPTQVDGKQAEYKSSNDTVTITDGVVVPNRSGFAIVDAVDQEDNIIKQYILEVIAHYSLTADLDGGVVDEALEDTFYGDDYDVYTFPVPTKTGFKFLGWYESESGKHITNTKNVRYNLSIVAKWERLTRYTVTHTQGEGYKLETNVSLRSIYQGTRLEIRIVPNPGYTAKNAVMKINGVAVALVNNAFTIPSVSSNMTLEITGIEVAEYIVTFKYLDDVLSTITTSQVISNPPTPPIVEGHTFSGWSVDINNIVESCTVYPLYTVNIYKVTFKYDGMEEEVMVEHGKSAVPTGNFNIPGKEFLGWDNDVSNVTNDIVVNAIYGSIKYKVTFIAFDQEYVVEVVQGNAAIPNLPDFPGYTLTGYDKDFSVVISDLVVNAIYTQNEYEVTFIMFDEIIKQQVKHGESATAVTPISKDGYTFIGYSDAFDNITSNKEITLIYLKDIVYVIYSIDGKEEKVAFDNGDLVSLKDPTRKGYSFNGWFMDEELTIPLDEYTITEDTTLYINWTKKTSCQGCNSSTIVSIVAGMLLIAIIFRRKNWL